MKFITTSLILSIGAIAGISLGLAITLTNSNLSSPSALNFLSPKKQQFTLSADALFESNKATIRAESFRLLDEVAAQLPLVGGGKVRVNGHINLRKTNNDDIALSYLRAAAVKEYLAKLRGESTYYWTIVGYGSSRPLTNRASNSDRIEIFVND
jgi:outer membrane protein OmpA-like peptidoglycan-associated protein